MRLPTKIDQAVRKRDANAATSTSRNAYVRRRSAPGASTGFCDVGAVASQAPAIPGSHGHARGLLRHAPNPHTNVVGFSGLDSGISQKLQGIVKTRWSLLSCAISEAGNVSARSFRDSAWQGGSRLGSKSLGRESPDVRTKRACLYA
jgi:hypothetical protein